jgi:hypothetical protein
MQPQRRGRRVAMTDAERDEFLSTQHTCRVATTSPAGPHVTPLWFWWDGTSLWLNSVFGSQRWLDLERDPRVAVVVDAGEDYSELRGVELRGRVEPVGEKPRNGEPNPELEAIEPHYALKYRGATDLAYDGRHAWLRLTPEKITSWDFRKMGS